MANVTPQLRPTMARPKSLLLSVARLGFGTALALPLLLASPSAGASSLAGGSSLASMAHQTTSHRAVAGIKKVPFKGTYRGTASLLIDNSSVSIPTVTGTGTATLVGKSTVSGQGSASASAQCDPFTGKGAIAGAGGKLELSVTKSKSTGCSSGTSGPVTVSFHGVAVVLGGTGSAKGASGNLKFSGKLALKGTSGSQNGPYTVTLTGTLSLKK
jgi:hypothetical protein